MNNQWKIEEFTALQIEENLSNKIFSVPRYQRGLVWKDKQKNDLVDTIKKGLPFGTLLLYKSGNGIYQVIDGLQRSNSILEFVKNPTQFFNEEDIDTATIKKLAELTGVNGNKTAIEEMIRELLISWVKNDHVTMKDVDSMQFSKFGRIVAEKFPTCKEKEFDIGDMIEPMMNNYQEICKTISTTKIPAIVMEGSDELLPLLFERINSKGTQLSKYQIFAATWSDKKYKLSDRHMGIVKANRDRYDLMLDGNGSIEDYDSTEFINKKELDAFEIAFGFGKYISEEYPHLFGKSSDEKSVESIGFTLLTGCLGLKNQQAKNMNTKLDELIGQSKIDIFLDKIMDSIKFADKIVGKYSKFKSNGRTNAGERPLHTEFQIASIIISIFLLRYAEIKIGDNDTVISIKYNFDHNSQSWKSIYEKALKKNAAKIYLMETFQKRWTGTGDKKMDQVIVTPDYYTKEVTKTDFEVSLDSWFEIMTSERSEFKRIASPKEQELLFLSAVYLSIFSAGQQVDGSNYDIEHLATQNLMKKHLDRFDGKLRLPISSIGNLCLLPEYANRSKKDKTIYDDNEYLKKSKMKIEDIENNYSFTSKTDLEWLNDETLPMDEFEDKYRQFIKAHFEKMKKKLIENYSYI